MKKALKIFGCITGIIGLILIASTIIFSIYDDGFLINDYKYKLEDYNINTVAKIDKTFSPDDFYEISEYNLDSALLNPYKQNNMYSVTDLPSGFKKFYFENSFFTANVETDEFHCFFCGDGSAEPCFGYFLSDDYRHAEWYISKNHSIQTDLENNISEILIVKNCEEKVIQPISYPAEFPRIDSSDSVKINNPDIMNKCVQQFYKTKYNFFENQTMQFERDKDYDFLINCFDYDPTSEYLVLAKFDDSGIYQMLGLISRADSVADNQIKFADISEDFTWNNYLYYAYPFDLNESESNAGRYYAHYYSDYYGLSASTLKFTVSEMSNNDFEYNLFSNGKAVITGYKGNSSEVIIPNQIDGYKVVGITNSIVNQEKFFDYNFKIKKVIVQEGIEFIGADVFLNCYALKDVTLPDSLMFIFDRAFWDCKSLKNINIPDNIQYIFQNAFDGCKKDIQAKISDDIIYVD